MARILCGVMGDALGHVAQARVLAQELSAHEFLFVGGGRVADLAAEGRQMERLPLLATRYRQNRLDLAATLRGGLKALAGLRPALSRLRGLIRAFDPQLILSLYEPWVPLAARQLGRPCLSLDNQHALSHCRPLGIPGQATGRLLLEVSLRGLYSLSSRYLVHSFFPLEPSDPARVEVFPPLVSPALRDLRPRPGEAVLVYQTSSTFQRLLPALEEWGQPCLVYGLGQGLGRGNLVFRPPDPEAFRQDLAACHFLVANGGHNAISEALYLGKPVLSLPIALAYEQYINSYMLRRLGYGDFSLDPAPGPGLFQAFAQRLPHYERAMAMGDFYGTDQLCRRLLDLLDPGPATPPRGSPAGEPR